jgi:hypothetical protein
VAHDRAIRERLGRHFLNAIAMKGQKMLERTRGDMGPKPNVSVRADQLNH